MPKNEPSELDSGVLLKHRKGKSGGGGVVIGGWGVREDTTECQVCSRKY